MTKADDNSDHSAVEDVKTLAAKPGAPADESTGGATSRILRGLAANIAGNGLTLAIQVITVPVLLGAWGVRAYGEWLILSATPLFLALSDLSIPTAAGNTMTMLVAHGKRADAATLGRDVWSLVTVATIGIVVVAAAAAYFLMPSMGADAAITVAEARIVVIALFAQVAIGNQFAVLDAYFRAGARYPLGVALRQSTRLLEFGALVGAVVLGSGAGGAAVAFLAGSLAGLIASWVVLHSAVPWARIALQRPHLHRIRSLIRPGLAFLAFPLGNAVSVQGLTIAVGVVMGPAAVVVFSTSRTVTRLVTQFMTSINLSVWPELSRSVAGGELHEARTILRRATQVSLLGAGVAGVILVATASTVIGAWTRGVVDPPLSLVAVLVAVVVANAVWFTLTTPLVATNRHGRLALVYLLSSLLAVALAVPLASQLGLIGAAIALLVIDAAMTVYVFRPALRVVADKPDQFVRALFDWGGIAQSIRALRASHVR